MLLSKLIHFVVLPPASLLIVALIGLALRRRSPRTGRFLFRGALVVLLALSTRIVGNFMLAPLENSAPPLTAQAASGAQAIVVLTSGVVMQSPEYGGDDAPDESALARMRYAARVQHDTGLPLLVTGGRIYSAQKQSLAANMASALRHDFRTDVKWVEEASVNTAENAAFSASILLPAGIKRIVLVTHAMHMQRAEQVFRSAGFEVVPAPTAYYSTGPFNAFQLLPSSSGLSASYYACYEWIGLAWYRLRH
ncbi:YdcF family protein [Pseudoduganella ginsengisoli]|uniref:YdcF family protein n=1 Tax=Pseudoduganella ginsengisoli TaxID=1462440 RepID=A0A6L6Q4Z6_9BURK|nr:YdcF family protein [Pseudoduganella ginsengisoli]MTW04222.1 YdcF family protein [Pseudoduganella ginsengisoli]